ncbi:fructose 2,6-bisphosphatase [Aeromicrobium flavum]|uniref:Fructose 2,6-bisphosphatase n=1 Tax=Aeromicrobium flavum TaxID=416568 RepID=A0A512HXX5_9ACTN|nr:histidine phosphatase family protein [Aeromicrobium flavum]GEO90299.1 fructose 2,6-bisphosphatase [Aeromicrobium flavum]
MGTLHLVRHGQASFGTDDYDRLSELGTRQSAALGTCWEAGGAVFTDAIAGGMLRHAQTAIAAIDASGLGEEDADPGLSGYDVDARWNEYDHLAVATAFDPGALQKNSKEFQAALNEAISVWRKGEGDFAEPYAVFRDRVMAGFAEAVELASQRGRRVLVFTSGGPIAMVVSHLITGDDSAFQKLNDVVVNSSVTTLMVGATGPRVLTFNDHGHLPAADVTFR